MCLFIRGQKFVWHIAACGIISCTVLLIKSTTAYNYFLFDLLQANCIDSTAAPEAVFASEVKKMSAENMKPQEQLTLEPYERDHAVVVGVYRYTTIRLVSLTSSNKHQLPLPYTPKYHRCRLFLEVTQVGKI